MAEEFPELCEAEQQAISEVLGTHVQRLATIVNGDCACTTHVPLTTTTHPTRTRSVSMTTIPETAPLGQEETIASLGHYGYGWSDSDVAGASAQRGLSEDVVRDISAKKSEPDWMLDIRLKALRIFEKKPMPNWGSNLEGIDFDNIKYFVRSTEKQADDLGGTARGHQEHLRPARHPRGGEAAAGRRRRRAVRVRGRLPPDPRGPRGARASSSSTPTRGLREHPELFKQYFGTVIPAGDNKFSALNTAVWSGGSFIYVPKGVHVDIPLQAYFRINTENMGQFERTLIIADEGSYVHYVEGCTAPIYKSDSLHSAVVEIIVKTRCARAATRRSRTGRTTSTTWSPSGPAPKPARPWSGSTATSAPRSP